MRCCSVFVLILDCLLVVCLHARSAFETQPKRPNVLVQLNTQILEQLMVFYAGAQMLY
jgi:hypothetical protein